ncbi:velvet factor-domain-containing protein, partial [Mucor mucedo]|uniref:velvet factor-domain-containing protein n=1 Tax=Mucor mucedo TaxID=29922 RepID=UPI0022201F41
TSMIPPPLGLGRPSQKSIKYKLIMIQNPVRARCCGFGEKDRRPIDPPPILQLFIEKPDGTLQNAHEDESNLSLFVVQCDLVSSDGTESRSHVFNPSSAISPPITNITNHSSDLSVRIEGTFCLKFMFMNLSAGDPLTMSTQVSDDVISNPFTVYSAKNFPGMTDSTSISQCFAQQGIKISIRKGRRIRRLNDRSFTNDTVADRSSSSTTHKEDPPVTTSTTTTLTTTTTTTTTTTSDTSSNNNNTKQVYKRIDISTYLTPS